MNELQRAFANRVFKFLIICTLFINYTQAFDDREHISVHEGLYITSTGGVIKYIDDIQINIILKLPTIKTLLDIMDELASCPNLFKGSAAQHLINDLTDTSSRINRYINSTATLLQKSNNVLLTLNKPHRSKRQALLLPILGAGLFAGVLTGVTQSQIHSINTHLDHTDWEVKNVQDRLSTLVQNDILFERNTAALMKSITTKTDDELHLIQCSQLLQYIAYRKKLEFVEYTDFINKLFHAPLSGSYLAKLTPDFLDLQSLSKLVKGHTSFNNTLFREKPETLYNIAKIAFISSDTRLSSAHFVMTVPAAHQHNFFPLYSIKQTAIHADDHNCISLNVPTHIYPVNDTFYPIDLHSCDNYFNLHICPSHAFIDASACTQPSYMNCTLTTDTCSSNHLAIITATGILFRNNLIDDSFYRNYDNKMSIISVSPQGIAFIDWKSAQTIQIHQTTYTAPNNTYTINIIRNFSTDFTLTNYNVTPTTLTQAFNSYFVKYNTSIDNLLDLTHKTTHNYLSSYHPHMIVVTATIISIIALLIIIMFLIRHIYRKNKQKHHELAHFFDYLNKVPVTTASPRHHRKRTSLQRPTSHPFM